MAEPILSWLNNDGNILEKLQFSSSKTQMQSVTADSTSLELKIKIANNFIKGSETSSEVDNASQCALEVTDAEGGTNSLVVTEQWISGKCGSDTSFHKMGAEVDESGHVINTLSLPISGTGADSGVICGTANDGTLENSGKNIANVTLIAQPPANTKAKAGKIQFGLTLVSVYGLI